MVDRETTRRMVISELNKIHRKKSIETLNKQYQKVTHMIQSLYYIDRAITGVDYYSFLGHASDMYQSQYKKLKEADR